MKKINISQVDSIFVNRSYPIEFLIYYKHGLPIDKIRKALKKLSSNFWPVFGEYFDGQINRMDYTEADYFDLSESQADFNSADKPENMYQTYHDANLLQGNKLFFLMVFQYPNGTVLLPKMNHLAGDGYSYFYFLSLLAAVSKDSSIPFKNSLIKFVSRPHHDRTVLKPFLLKNIKLEKPEAAEKLSIEFVKMPKREIRPFIKQIALKTNQTVSSNDILSAIAVQKSYAIQMHKFSDVFTLTIPIDVRTQIKEYGAKYFGNGLLFNQTIFNTAEITQTNIENMAVQIRKSMPVISKENYITYLDKIEQQIKNGQTDKLVPYNPFEGCLVTNLSRLPTGKLNFGSGNPDFIIPITIEKNSTVVLAEKDNFILRLVYQV